MPKAVAIATLEELAVTATDDAQQIACAGLVDELGSKMGAEPEPAADPTDSAHGDLRSFRTADVEAQEAVLDAALSSYAKATRGSLAESSIAQRRSYESDALTAVEHAAHRLGLEYGSDTRVAFEGVRSPPHTLRVDAVVKRPGGTMILVETNASPRLGNNTIARFVRLANDGTFPLLIVSLSLARCSWRCPLRNPLGAGAERSVLPISDPL